MPKNQIEKEIEYVLSAAIAKCGDLNDAKDLTQETIYDKEWISDFLCAAQAAPERRLRPWRNRRFLPVGTGTADPAGPGGAGGGRSADLEPDPVQPKKKAKSPAEKARYVMLVSSRFSKVQ